MKREAIRLTWGFLLPLSSLRGHRGNNAKLNFKIFHRNNFSFSPPTFNSVKECLIIHPLPDCKMFECKFPNNGIMDRYKNTLGACCTFPVFACFRNASVLPPSFKKNNVFIHSSIHSFLQSEHFCL